MGVDAPVGRSTLLLTNDDVRCVLDMGVAISALRAGYADLAVGDATYVPRIDVFAPTGRGDDFYQWGSMTGVSLSAGVLAVRMKSDVVAWPNGATQEKYCMEPGTYCGLILVFRITDGAPLAIVQDGYLQHMRVGAAAGIGTDLLAREDATVLGLLGSGGMARSYLEAIAAVRPLSAVRVYSPTPANRHAFAEAIRVDFGIAASAADSAEAAVRGAQIVATATDSMAPTFDPEWLDPGSHVVCVTRREISQPLLDRCDRVIQLGIASIPRGVDVPGMEWKAGGMAAYVCGPDSDRKRVPSGAAAERGAFPTLTDVHRGDVPGRTDPDQITMFVNVGTQGLQFATVAAEVVRRAADIGIGRALPMAWFLEDIRD